MMSFKKKWRYYLRKSLSTEIDIKLKKSDFEQVKKLRNDFEIICKILCSKVKSIDERLKNIEVKNES